MREMTVRSPLAVSTEEQLFQAIHTKVQREKGFLVGVDGVQGSGKTRISRRIGAEINCAVIECDLFIRHGKHFYPEILDMDGLRSILTTALDRRQPVVVESIMLGLILSAMKIEQDLGIYVKRYASNGKLVHAELFDKNLTENDLIEKENEICRIDGISDDEPELFREIIKYHKNWLPHEKAAIVFENTFGSE